MVTTRSSTSTDGVVPATPASVRAANGFSSPSSPSSSSPSSSTRWTHAPTNWTLLWLVVSLPLVIWDFIYCLFRPYTMPGGAWHWPIWSPYELYGKIDGMYGWPSFNERNGFTSAQALLNVIETGLYAYYLYLYLSYGKPGTKGSSAPAAWTGNKIGGSTAGLAALVGFSGAVMTLSKSVLYWLVEYYSGYRMIGHNNFQDLIILWVIPNGAWLVGSGYMTVSIGNDLLKGLSIAAGHAKRE